MPPKSRKLLSYLAGFFDGEGNIGITETNKKHGYRLLRVGITQKDKCILNLFQCLFGGSISKHCKDDCFRWYCYASEALNFLTDISPYLMLKAGQARIGIEFQIAKNARRRKPTDESRVIEEAQEILMREGKKIAICSS